MINISLLLYSAVARLARSPHSPRQIPFSAFLQLDHTVEMWYDCSEDPRQPLLDCMRQKRPAAASCVDQNDENNHMGRLCTSRSFICPTRASPGSRARRMATRLRGMRSRRRGRSGTGRLLAHQVSRIRRDHNGRRGSLRRIPASQTHELRAAAARPIAATRQHHGTNRAMLRGGKQVGAGWGGRELTVHAIKDLRTTAQHLRLGDKRGYRQHGAQRARARVPDCRCSRDVRKPPAHRPKCTLSVARRSQGAA